MLNDKYEHGFAVDWMRKDLAIVLAEVVAVQVTNFLEYCTDCKSNTWVLGATGFISGTSSYNLPR